MSQATLASMKTGGMVVLTVLLFFVLAGGPAKADPCAEACRAQHNACRMAAKLLFSGRCDALLQGCIMQCFADARMNRDRALHEGRDFRDFRDRRGPPVLGGPPDLRGPGLRGPDMREPGLREPELRGPPLRGPEPRDLEPRGQGLRGQGLNAPEGRIPPRDFRDFRDGVPPAGQRWLGGPGGWRGGY